MTSYVSFHCAVNSKSNNNFRLSSYPSCHTEYIVKAGYTAFYFQIKINELQIKICKVSLLKHVNIKLKYVKLQLKHKNMKLTLKCTDSFFRSFS